MDGVSVSALSLLGSDISLSTSLDRLHATLAHHHVGLPPSRTQLQRELERHPETFRLVVPDRGPWRTRGNDRLDRSTATRPSTPPPLVVPVDPMGMEPSFAGNGPSREKSPGLSGRLRRSVYWLGARMDEDSPRDVARWVCLAHSCAQTERMAGIRRQSTTEPAAG